MYTMIELGKACKQHFDRRRRSNQRQVTCRVGLWYMSPTSGVFILVETRLSHFTGSRRIHRDVIVYIFVH